MKHKLFITTFFKENLKKYFEKMGYEPNPFKRLLQTNHSKTSFILFFFSSALEPQLMFYFPLIISMVSTFSLIN